jgi:hypothetical protein
VTPGSAVVRASKIENMENRHVEMEHGTPPLRVFGSRISRVLDFRVSLSGHSKFYLAVLGIRSPVFKSGTPARPTSWCPPLALGARFKPRTPARPTPIATSRTNPRHAFSPPHHRRRPVNHRRSPAVPKYLHNPHHTSIAVATSYSMNYPEERIFRKR